MIDELKRALEEEGFGIDEQGDLDSDTPIERAEPGQRKDMLEKGLRDSAKSDTVGIYKCSQ